MTKIPASRVEAIDRLGALKERIAKLQVEHDALEEKLRRRLGHFHSEHYDFTVFDVEGKKFNWTKAKKLLGEKYDKLWVQNVFRSSRLTKIEIED